MDDLKIRDATADDLQAIDDIYNHYVLTCTCTWQTAPEPMQARREWFAAHGGKFPVIVGELGGQVVGWGALSPYHRREGYQFTVENSVYVRPGLHGKGIGTTLLKELIQRAKALGHRSIVAVISGDQTPSIALHAKHGFAEAGRLREAGYKFEKWLDVVYMQKMLND